MNNILPPDVQSALEGLGVVTYDGAITGMARRKDLHLFTIRDPEFPKCQPTFGLRANELNPQSLLSAYARTMREFAGEFTKENSPVLPPP